MVQTLPTNSTNSASALLRNSDVGLTEEGGQPEDGGDNALLDELPPENLFRKPSVGMMTVVAAESRKVAVVHRESILEEVGGDDDIEDEKDDEQQDCGIRGEGERLIAQHGNINSSNTEGQLCTEV
jgi:hypothetical protein